MKKFIALIITVSMVLSLCACNGDELDQTDNSTSNTPESSLSSLDEDSVDSYPAVTDSDKIETNSDENKHSDTENHDQTEVVSNARRYNPQTGEWEIIEKRIEFEEYWIQGAPDDVSGREAYIEEVLAIFGKFNCSKLYVEYQIDGGLYIEIYCERKITLAEDMAEELANRKTGYEEMVFVSFIDEQKSDDDLDIDFYAADIWEDGTYDGYID